MENIIVVENIFVTYNLFDFNDFPFSQAKSKQIKKQWFINWFPSQWNILQYENHLPLKQANQKQSQTVYTALSIIVSIIQVQK